MEHSINNFAVKFRDFKIIIDGTLDNDEDAEAIKQIFGKSVKVEKEEPTDKTDDGSDPEKTNTVFPLQQEIELKKADQGKSSDTIDDMTDNEDIEAEQDSIPLPTLLGGEKNYEVDDKGQPKDEEDKDEDDDKKE